MTYKISTSIYLEYAKCKRVDYTYKLLELIEEAFPDVNFEVVDGISPSNMEFDTETIRAIDSWITLNADNVFTMVDEEDEDDWV